jgi:hypothetical protein
VSSCSEFRTATFLNANTALRNCCRSSQNGTFLNELESTLTSLERAGEGTLQVQWAKNQRFQIINVASTTGRYMTEAWTNRLAKVLEPDFINFNT